MLLHIISVPLCLCYFFWPVCQCLLSLLLNVKYLAFSTVVLLSAVTS